MARKPEAKKAEKPVILIEGRLINSSLFEKDAFDDKSTPSYKIEVAFPKDHEQIDRIAEALLSHAEETWGKGMGELNIDGGDLISGVLDGDKLAAKREKLGKEGTAYADTWVVRANTIFNLHGQDAPGGIQVWDEEVEPVGPANQQVIYPGCYVQIAVSVSDYEDDRSGNHALKFYLSAVQKTGDGEKLSTTKDTSALFKPVGRKAPAEGGARSRRAG